MSQSEWVPIPGGWALLDASGDAVDSLTNDPATGSYRDSRGVPVGREWGAAKECCERRADKWRKVGRR